MDSCQTRGLLPRAECEVEKVESVVGPPKVKECTVCHFRALLRREIECIDPLRPIIVAVVVAAAGDAVLCIGLARCRALRANAGAIDRATRGSRRIRSTMSGWNGPIRPSSMPAVDRIR